MALFGSLSRIFAQAPVTNEFAAAFAYAARVLRPGTDEHRRLFALTPGMSERVELGGGVYAIEQVYQSKPRAECFFESHRKYLDVQVIAEGSEAMEVEDIDRLSVVQPYLEERDLIKYADPGRASRLLVRDGEAAIFFPTDGHMPCLQSDGEAAGLVRKTVVKVPVAGA